ncbi:MAG: 2-polyprenyl-6-methoxyphenol hydroxylase-like oxidoreductase [Luteitalea sp.]|nr:2-polyprenyl-6-methoxyphenol hydroxylase-like oxidoreductase [Luteitalea sp.]
MSTPSGQCAVVVGGSVAGLLAARVLAEHFRQVIVIERDALRDAPLVRTGTPQASHAHVLLQRGRRILSELLPGLEEDLLAAGALLLDFAKDVAWLTPAGWGVRYDSELPTLSCSRALLEWAVRRHVVRLTGIHIQSGFRVVRLVERQGAVVGVTIRAARCSGDVGQTLDAELVVDASGRGSAAPQWLQALGYPRPSETTVNAFHGYASRIFRAPSDPARDWMGLYLQPKPPSMRRLGILMPIEMGQWHVSLGGAERDYPPTDDEGFLEFARSLRSPILYDAITAAEPVSPIYATRATANRVRHFERLSRGPAAFLVVADAACAFNPVYGQGMTTAAIGALLLREHLRASGSTTVSRAERAWSARFQTRLAAINRVPWMLATGEDCRFKGSEGRRLDLELRVMHRYLDRVVALTTHDPAVRDVLLRTFNLLIPPSRLFHPSILAKVARQAITLRSISLTDRQDTQNMHTGDVSLAIMDTFTRRRAPTDGSSPASGTG